MSRNLCRQTCSCGGRVSLVGEHYNLPDDHFSQPGMEVCDAQCDKCDARYTAWIGPTRPTLIGGVQYGNRDIDLQLIKEYGFYDLSYRSTFNDEPGPDDFPPKGAGGLKLSLEEAFTDAGWLEIYLACRVAIALSEKEASEAAYCATALRARPESRAKAIVNAKLNTILDKLLVS